MKNPSHNTWDVGWMLEISLPPTFFLLMSGKRLLWIAFHSASEYVIISAGMSAPNLTAGNYTTDIIILISCMTDLEISGASLWWSQPPTLRRHTGSKSKPMFRRPLQSGLRSISETSFPANVGLISEGSWWSASYHWTVINKWQTMSSSFNHRSQAVGQVSESK